MALIVVKEKDGSVSVNDAPDEHTFAARFIDRELESGLVEVEVRLVTSEGIHVYALESFERNEDGTVNLTGWVTRKVS